VLDWSLVSAEVVDMGFVHLGFITVALAYAARDVLHLRLLAVLGYGFFLAALLQAVSPPSLSQTGWYGVFFIANLVHAVWLARDRRREHISPEERLLLDRAFPSLAIGPARRLMRLGRWATLPDGSELTAQGRAGEAVYALLSGNADILVDGERIHAARAGQFVGEIGFLAGGSATATARARGELRALVWDRRILEKAMRRSPEIHDTVYAAFGCDLARKVAEQSLRPRQTA
jgi:hypothetical protein